MAIAGTLEIQMSSNIARITKDMADTKRVVGGAMSSVESAVASAKSALGALGIGLGAGYFVSLIKGSIDALDHLKDLSKSTNILAEDLAGLKLAAAQSGGDLDSIAASINKLSVNMGKDAEKFKALGVSAKDPLEAFKQLSDIFVAIQDPQQRAAVMAEALGKSWAGAAPLLAEGSKKIGEMVANGRDLSKVTTALTEEADAFNDKMKQLTSTGGLLTGMLGPLLPLLNTLADDMLKAQKSTAGAGSSFSVLAETLRPVIVLVGNFAYVWRTVGIAAAGSWEQMDGFRNGGIAGFLKSRELVKKILADERADFDAWERKIMRAGTLPKIGAEDWQGRLGTGDGGIGGRAGRFIGGGAVKATGANKELEKLLALGAKGELEAADARVKIWEDEIKAINDLRNAGFAEDAKLLALGVKGEEDAAEARAKARMDEMIAINDARNAALDAQAKTTDEITEFWKSAAQSMQQSMSSFFFDIMQGDLKNLGSNFKRTIDKMVADHLAAKAATALFGADFGKGGSIGGLVGKGLDWLKSGSGMTGGDFGASVAGVPAYAMGTDYVPRTGLALVHQGERITPAGQSSGDGVSLVFNNDFRGADASAITAMNARLAQFERSVVPQVVDAVRRGGAARSYVRR